MRIELAHFAKFLAAVSLLAAVGAPSRAEDVASFDGQPVDNVEVVRERYPNRAVKIEREVIQDATQNYVNHGSWKMWDQQGKVVLEGQYQHDKREGTWNRWYRPAEVELLNTQPYRQFQGPYLSQATFKNGQLNGRWTIYDSKQAKISEWEFRDGVRHGTSTWWYPTGRKMREVVYNNGEADGERLEWAPDGNLAVREVFEQGRKVDKKVESYPGGQKKSEGVYLFAKLALIHPDEWDTATMARHELQGKDERHGSWTAWYPTGQIRQQGQYKHDAPVGSFTWWYTNGQVSLQAEYVDGKQQGAWTWWHENGQKAIHGEYTHGDPSGQWIWWKESGKVAQRADFSDHKGRMLAAPSLQDAPLPTDATSRRAGNPLE